MCIHISFHLHTNDLQAPYCGFVRDPVCVLRMRKVKGGEPQVQPTSCRNGLFCQFSIKAARKQSV